MLLPVVTSACVLAAAGVVAACGFAWLWSGRRGLRLRAQTSSPGSAPGEWRFALYGASLLFWPAGVLGLLAFSSAGDVHVGTSAFRCALVNLAVSCVVACVGLSLAAGYLAAYS